MISQGEHERIMTIEQFGNMLCAQLRVRRNWNWMRKPSRAQSVVPRDEFPFKADLLFSLLVMAERRGRRHGAAGASQALGGRGGGLPGPGRLPKHPEDARLLPGFLISVAQTDLWTLVCFSSEVEIVLNQMTNLRGRFNYIYDTLHVSCFLSCKSKVSTNHTINDHGRGFLLSFCNTPMTNLWNEMYRSDASAWTHKT